MNTLSTNTTATVGQNSAPGPAAVCPPPTGNAIPGPTPLPPAGAPASGPSDNQPRASAPPPSPAASTPPDGESRSSQSAPDPHVPSRDELVAATMKLFGDKLECIHMNDERIPKILRDDLQRLKITEQNEFLAVSCGPLSNLAVLVLPFIKKGVPEYHAFIDLNPKLEKSLMTTWNSVLFLWMRIDGWRPVNHALPGALWISDGMVPTIVERVTAANPLYFQKRGDSIVTINFDELKWPPAVEDEFFLSYIVDHYGPYVRQVGPRKKVLNEQTVGRILSRSLALMYDTDGQTFYRIKSKDNTVEPMTTNQVVDLVSKTLQQSTRFNSEIPQTELRLPRMKDLVESIKVSAAFTRLGARESLFQFVRERLFLKPRSNVSVEEIHFEYLKYARAQNLVVYPRPAFYRVLPAAIMEVFTLTRVNNIQRPVPGTTRTTARRGFHGVAFRTDGTDGMDAKDVSDGVIKKPFQGSDKSVSDLSGSITN